MLCASCGNKFSSAVSTICQTCLPGNPILTFERQKVLLKMLTTRLHALRAVVMLKADGVPTRVDWNELNFMLHEAQNWVHELQTSETV